MEPSTSRSPSFYTRHWLLLPTGKAVGLGDALREESVTSTTPSTADFTSSNTLSRDKAHSSDRLQRIKEHRPAPSKRFKAWPSVAGVGVVVAGFCSSILLLGNSDKRGLSDSIPTTKPDIGGEYSLRKFQKLSHLHRNTRPNLEIAPDSRGYFMCDVQPDLIVLPLSIFPCNLWYFLGELR